jgi:thymidylate synthase (FAD)
MPVDKENLAEISLARAERNTTARPTVQAIEEILFQPFDVLDHGFVRVIDYMGDDSSVVQAARVSYGRGTKKLNEDRGLIRYLMAHSHTTPFEMAELKIHVKLPIFVARQWVRHRTASLNEYSARYSVLDREFYIPEVEQISSQSTNNRQGRGELLKRQKSEYVQELLRDDANRNYNNYLQMINSDDAGQPLREGEDGLARELARMNLTLNTYTQWYWKANLHNIFNFLRLRADPHAQYEIRVYADIILDIVKRWMPLSHEAFIDYKLNSATISSQSIAVIKRLIKGEQVTQESSGLTLREWTELQRRFEFGAPSA